MCEARVSRLVCIVMALFPALWGVLGLLNNTADFTGTAQNAVGPLLAMKDTYHVPGQAWRAINFASAPLWGLGFITAMETLAGFFALVGIFSMLKNFFRPYADFSRGKAWAMLGAMCAILVWGIGFMVIAGDWFMAWQAKENSLSTQLGAMIYMVPCSIALVILLLQRDDLGR